MAAMRSLAEHSAAVAAAASHHLHLAEKALALLTKGAPIDSLAAASYTPEAAAHALVLAQSHRPLLLAFLRWVTPLPFFSASLRPQSIALHLLSRLRRLPAALSLSRRLVSRFPLPALFDSLASTLPLLRRPPSNPSAAFDILIRSYSSLSLIPQALSALSLTKDAGFSPTLLSYNSVLDAMCRCGRTPRRTVEEFVAGMVGSGVSLNVYTYNILIRGFCSWGELDRASALLSEMMLAGCSPNVVTYNTLIDGLCKSGKVENARLLLRTMKEIGLKPNLVTFNSIVNGLCREGRMKESSKLVNEMVREGLAPDAITHNTLVNGYCREGDLHEALLLQEEMAGKGVAPNIVTYTSLVNAMCKAGNLKRAMELVNQMRERGLRLNEVTFTTLIDGFCKKGFLDDALLIVKQMKDNGIKLTVVSYNALINGYCMLGRMDEALRILQEDMRRNGLTPDVVSYSTILSGYCKNGDIDLAFKLNQEMLDNGILPDVITYSSLIRGLCEVRRLDDACKHFQKMLSLGLKPDEFTYTTLIDGHCKEGEMKKALLLHDDMIRKGILPDDVTYSVLINGLQKVARTKEAKRLLFKMYYDECVPDSIKYDVLIDCCGKAEFKSVLSLLKGFCIKGLMNEADKVFNSIAERNWKCDATAYNVIIHGHCRAGNVCKAVSLYEEMLQAGFLPNALTAISLIKCLSQSGMSKELNQVIQQLLGRCLLTDAETPKVIIEVNHKDGNIEAVLNALSDMSKDGLLPNGGELKECTI
ncbi:pentatricopeptide repeat-containing protein [Canna indica]|uniref:Pentatricopeptide repeat-containing protein n=1 Tax=Canna indica TaxID=4628 RepID=A0AAQ3L729_9LILI|nr:pentatricopeptide repeat-containing protein [Canna indica]